MLKIKSIIVCVILFLLMIGGSANVEKNNVTDISDLKAKVYSDHIKNYDRIFSNDDYITANAKVSYTWRFITAFVGVNNIFNEKYSEYGVYSWFRSQLAYYPSPGVNFLGGLSVKF